MQLKLSHKILLKALMNSQQYFSNNAARALPTLSNCSAAHPFQTVEIQIDLKLAIITSTYKGGFNNLPKNYRPVSLTTHLIKILEKNSNQKYQPISRKASEN